MTLPVRPRNWFSFNLRALLIVVTLFAVAFAAVTQYYLPFQRQRAAIAALNGRYGYASQRPAAPAWMRRWFGEQNFQDVVELHLENMGTTDDDLQHVAQLPHLEKLYLAHNPKITDKGLAHLRGLPKLRRMSLYRTKVTGAGFEHLATCPGLAEIDANEIPITEEMLTHLAKMPQLTWLATPAMLEEPILLQVADFPKESAFDYRYGLHCSRLTDASVPALAKMHGASSMTLSECRFSPSAWKDFRPPAMCTNLWLHKTLIPGDVAAEFLAGGGTQQFAELHLAPDSVDFESLAEHLHGKQLVSAWIHRDAFQLVGVAALHCFGIPPQAPRELCTHMHVKTLSIETNNMGDAIGQVAGLQELQVNCVATPDMFRGFRQLKDLRLLNLTGVAADEFDALGELRELETLVLPGHLPTEQLRFLAKLTKLKQLKLSGNLLDAETMKLIGSMKQLRNLRMDFAGPTLTDEAFAALSGCENLEMLSCAGARITDDSISVLKKLPKLRFANLAGTQISHVGKKEIERVISERIAAQGPIQLDAFDADYQPAVLH